VPLTPASGLRITNAGVVLVQEPIVAAAGQKVPRNKYLPAPAAKKFNLTPGQCVECPAGSKRTADGIACEGEAGHDAHIICYLLNLGLCNLCVSCCAADQHKTGEDFTHAKQQVDS
jgi:hypothetical protein